MNTGNGYLLAEQDALRIFQQDIAPDLLTGSPRADPIAVFIGGQAGAGKSTIQAAVLERIARPAAVCIDVDDLRAYHPRWEPLALADDLTAAALTQPDAQRWLRMAVAHCLERRIDVVLSTTLAHPPSAEALLTRFRSGRYRTHVAFVAVHEAHSRIGVLERYLALRGRVGYGRYVPPATQEAAYRGVLTTADLIDRRQLADQVEVYRRDGAVLYSRDMIGVPEPTATRLTLEGERNRTWTPAEQAEFVSCVAKLRSNLPDALRADLDEAASTAGGWLRGPQEVMPSHSARVAFPRQLALTNPGAPSQPLHPGGGPVKSSRPTLGR